jgi:Mg2+ and Co2+ transporter CorA
MQLSLQLSASRNLLLRTDLFITATTLCVAAGGLVPGIFGMNLNSAVQESDGWFRGVILITVFGIVACSIIAYIAISRYV